MRIRNALTRLAVVLYVATEACGDVATCPPLLIPDHMFVRVSRGGAVLFADGATFEHCFAQTVDRRVHSECRACSVAGGRLACKDVLPTTGGLGEQNVVAAGTAINSFEMAVVFASDNTPVTVTVRDAMRSTAMNAVVVRPVGDDGCSGGGVTNVALVLPR